MDTPSKAVFLSYASQDAEAAQHVCEALQAVGVEVWFDQSALRGGDAWDASIRRQIKDCALFVPIISTATNMRSEGYFRLEWKLAVDRSHLMADDKAFLLPVVIDATLDASARVPERFRDVQWSHLPDDRAAAAFAEHVQRLLSAGGVPAAVTRSHAVPRAAAAIAVATRQPESPSIAVLPFVNRSSSAEDEYFSDGLADELLNVLAKIRGLRVAARTSSFSFKGKQTTIAEVGQALNVATVLEGSVRKAGNRMRISVQLVKVADGYHLWSETYDRTLEDIFAVQDDIAQSVVQELRTKLLGETADAKVAQNLTAQVAAAVKGRASDPEAYRLYLQARHFLDRFTRDDTTKGIAYLKRALQLDAVFALAWAELGRAYSNEASNGWAPVTEGYARVREAVARALTLEPDLAEGHAQMGWIQMMHDRDWRGAEASYCRALEMAPGNAGVLRRASALAANSGRIDEAIALGGRAVEQDPLSATAYSNLGAVLNVGGRLSEAEAAFSKSLELAPERAVTRGLLSLVLVAQGRTEEALTEALREPERWCRLSALAIIYHAADRRDESEVALQELIANHSVDAAYQVATVYAARCETDLAFAWLERGYVQHDTGLSDMKSDPLLRSLHSDPRWGVFLHKMGLAD
jgi:TolB-like protein/cytochrome c-type biogenesis protein CcmH/NrfG